MKDAVLAIGKFEGLHLGHNALLNQASAVMVFNPHPYKVLFDKSYKPLFTDHERNHIFKQIGINSVISVPFDEAFAKLSPKAFCEMIFRDFKHVIVGENYRFGSGRAGDAAFMQAEAARYGATVQIIPMQQQENEQAISTSIIRELIAACKVEEANKLLGYPFFIMGKAAGFPTLNIYPPQDKFLPPDGVYATTTHVNGVPYASITNISLQSVETHLFDYANTEESCDVEIKVEIKKAQA